jgi:hypothetical protein
MLVEFVNCVRAIVNMSISNVSHSIYVFQLQFDSNSLKFQFDKSNK